MQEVFDAANRNNTAIYAVDPRGLATASSTSTTNVAMQRARNADVVHDTLRVLADNTDGRAIVNRNDLGAAMKQIMRDSSAYYLVGYNPRRRRRTASSTRSRCASGGRACRCARARATGPYRRRERARRRPPADARRLRP